LVFSAFSGVSHESRAGIIHGVSSKRLGSLSVVSGMTLLSRVLGLVREVVFARFLGAGAAMDVFVVAFQIPNFLRRLFAEGAFSQAFVPVISEYRKDRGHDEVRALSDRVAGTLAVILLAVTIVGMIAAPAVIWLFASGFDGADSAKFDLSVDLLRITFPYLFFISMTSFCAGVLNTFDRFAAPAFTPVLLNVCMIGAVIVAAPYFEEPVVALAWGVFVAGLVQLVFQFPFLLRIHMFPRPRFDLAHEGVRRILTLMLPAIFGASVAQVNLLIDRKIASYLEDGSIAWLYYSDRLLEFPLGVFAIALGTVILPGLSRQRTAGDDVAFANTLDWGLRWVALISVPAACGLFVLAGPMVSAVYLYGEFNEFNAQMVRFSLMAYALGLVGFSLVKVLVPGYFARQDTRTPVRIGVKAMLFNVIANLVLVGLMVHYDIVAPHAGLALATVLSAWLNAFLLWRGLRREGAYTANPGWGIFVLRVLVATLVMGVVIHFLAGQTSVWFDYTAAQRIVRLAGIIGLGAVSYALVLGVSGLRPRDMRALDE
jgi:putative peptidoglycan lipid II flippase